MTENAIWSQFLIFTSVDDMRVHLVAVMITYIFSCADNNDSICRSPPLESTSSSLVLEVCTGNLHADDDDNDDDNDDL